MVVTHTCVGSEVARYSLFDSFARKDTSFLLLEARCNGVHFAWVARAVCALTGAPGTCNLRLVSDGRLVARGVIEGR